MTADPSVQLLSCSWDLFIFIFGCFFSLIAASVMAGSGREGILLALSGFGGVDSNQGRLKIEV